MRRSVFLTFADRADERRVATPARHEERVRTCAVVEQQPGDRDRVLGDGRAGEPCEPDVEQWFPPLSRAAAQIGAGVPIGLAVATLMVQTMEGGKADIRGVFVLLGVAAFMAAVGFVAALGPARRALKIQPTETSRTD